MVSRLRNFCIVVILNWDVANWLLYKGGLIIQCTFNREVLFGTLLGSCFERRLSYTLATVVILSCGRIGLIVASTQF